jgi:transcription initiation factor TFIIIB Brf1 subunit/transcription initiation factor TFIIB
MNTGFDSEDYALILEKESNHRPSSTMLENQAEITYKARAIAVNWLSAVNHSHKMPPEVFHLAINILDRVLSKYKSIKRNRFQMIAITCLFIAEKYEQEYEHMGADHAAELTNGLCKPSDIINSEIVILNMLEWNMGSVTIASFLHIYLYERGLNKTDVEHLIWYVAAITTLDHSLTGLNPSLMSAAIIYVSNTILNKLSVSPDWTRDPPSVNQDLATYVYNMVIPSFVNTNDDVYHTFSTKETSFISVKMARYFKDAISKRIGY